jgi:hypothetical protein
MRHEGALRTWQDQQRISPGRGIGPGTRCPQGAPGGPGRGGLCKGDMVMITGDDFAFLRRAIDIAAAAITTGDDPYGSLLAGPGGEILAEAHNTVRRDHDITAHPELKLARWAARELDPDTPPGPPCTPAASPAACVMVRSSVLGSAASSTPCRPSSGLSSIPVLNGRTCPATGLRCSTRRVSPSTATASRNPRPGPVAMVIDRCGRCSASTEPIITQATDAAKRATGAPYADAAENGWLDRAGSGRLV